MQTSLNTYCLVLLLVCCQVFSISSFSIGCAFMERGRMKCFSSDKPKYQPREKRPRKTRFKSLEDYLYPHLVRPRIQTRERRLASVGEVVRDQDGIPIENFRAPRQVRSDIKSKYASTQRPRRNKQGEALAAGMTQPSLLTVMGGTASGTRLDSPRVHLRPMMGKAKESFFSSLLSSGIYAQPGVTVSLPPSPLAIELLPHIHFFSFLSFFFSLNAYLFAVVCAESIMVLPVYTFSVCASDIARVALGPILWKWRTGNRVSE